MLSLVLFLGMIIVLVSNRLPQKFIRANVAVMLCIILSCLIVKKVEVGTKSNVIGTSFGYLFGQLKFYNMINSSYEIPLRKNTPYPSELGAEFAIKHHTDLVLIVVESLGVPRNDFEKNYLLGSFNVPIINNLYRIEEGKTVASGSTIQGEIRELCFGRLEQGLFGQNAESCLPGILKKLGYETTVFHANYAKMYGRDKWYPKIGFDHYINSDSGVLPNDIDDYRWGTASDSELLGWISKLSQDDKLSFKYILTISSHLPAKLLPNVKMQLQCSEKLPLNVCTHISNLRFVLNSIAEFASKSRNTTFVIVGDHPPPFMAFNGRSNFEENNVPYFLLLPNQ